MISIEVTAKKVGDAIKEGLAKLDAKLDDVNVEILSQGGLFKKAKVRLTIGEPDAPAAAEKPARPEKAERSDERTDKPIKPARPMKADKAPVEKTDKTDKTEKTGEKAAAGSSAKADRPAAKERADKPAKAAPKRRPERKEENSAEITPEIMQAAEAFLTETVKLMGVDASLRSEIDGRQLKIEIVTDDNAVIGYRGEALDALEYLSSLVAGRGNERFVKLRLDCNGYRAKREESLVALANRMADKCAKSGKKVTLDPMSSAHRRIIHAALTADERVVTKSEGKEPGRRIVILPKRKAE